MARSFLIASCVICFGIMCATTESDTVYSPEYLLSMGKSLNSPLLKLMGLAMLCNRPSCSEWSEWTACYIKPENRLGIWNRTRVCGDKDPRCRSAAETKNETERGLCEALFCPLDYQLTQHGYCLKLFTELVNHTVAMARCEQGGGYLVNVNSDQKLGDIRNEFNHNVTVHIDGERQNISSPWEYTYGPDPVDLNWHSPSSQPTNGPEELCVAVTPDFQRFDASCTPNRYFMCEIVRDIAQ